MPLLYDLTSLQREANTRYGFSAKRTLGAAQRCYEEHKALTYPRTSSRYLTSDMVPELKEIAAKVGHRPEYAKAAAFVGALDLLPLKRVVDDAKVGDHHAIIPTNAEHKLEKFSDDDRKIYDMVTRRFLAAFHPPAEWENTRIETTVAAHIFRTRGKVLVVAGWRGVYGELPEEEKTGVEEDEGRDQTLPKLEQGEGVDTTEVESAAKETKPPRRYSDASLLGAMETAGKLVDDDEAREAMKESGIGTPATRSSIIERLIDVGYVERDGRALVATEKGLNVIRLLADHPLTSPALTGDWERRLGSIEAGQETRKKFMADIAKFAGETIGVLDTTLKDVKIPRANLGPCPVCGHDIIENRKGYSCWGREDPGCGFVIWKSKAGKTLPPVVVRELVQTGQTAKQVTGFKGRSGRSFRAKLALMQNEEGRWRVEFDEAWAKEGAKPPEGEDAGEATATAAAAEPVKAVASEGPGQEEAGQGRVADRRLALGHAARDGPVPAVAPACACVGDSRACFAPDSSVAARRGHSSGPPASAALATPAGTRTAPTRAVTATLSWSASQEEYDGVATPRLRIDAGRASSPLDAGIGDLCDGCFFFGDEENPTSQVADLDGDGEPEVLVRTTPAARTAAPTLGDLGLRGGPRHLRPPRSSATAGAG